MEAHPRLVLPPGGLPALLAALKAKREEVRRALTDPSTDDRDAKRAAALRVAILERVASKPGVPLSSVADTAGCSIYTVRRVIGDFNDRGMDAVYPRRAGRKPDALAEKQIVQELKLLFEQMPDARPKELA
ncbi:MAG: hypothetical protein K2P78_11945 [Gemmataceae bacterium]|nr:hypothetical protein [Gemmataceae bacterium]